MLRYEFACMWRIPNVEMKNEANPGYLNPAQDHRARTTTNHPPSHPNATYLPPAAVNEISKGKLFFD